MPTVLVVSQPGGAGVAHVITDHVSWMTAAGWQVVVACDPGSRLAELVTQRGAATRPWSAARAPGLSLVRETRTLRQIVDELAPDLVHLHSSKAGLAGRLAVRGRLPTVFQPHAWSFEAATGPMAALTVRWERLATRWTDLTVCVSHAEDQLAASRGVRGRRVVLTNSVDLDRFSPGDRHAARRSIAGALDAGPEEPLAVAVGRLCRQKGQDLLLAAWPMVRSAVPRARLVLVGDGPERDRLAAELPEGVSLIGSVLDPMPWLRAADVVVLPSRWEGQALVLLEAMACGVSVVTSDIDANVETLPSGAGELVHAENRVALAEAVARRLGDRALADTEGRSGRAHVVAHHSPGVAAEKLLGTYATCLGHRMDDESGRTA